MCIWIWIYLDQNSFFFNRKSILFIANKYTKTYLQRFIPSSFIINDPSSLYAYVDLYVGSSRSVKNDLRI